MAWFGTPNNTPSGDVNVNTSFFKGFGKESMLTIGGWNDMISIKMSPASGTNESGLTNYDSKQGISTALTKDNIQVILEAIEEKILPKMKAFKAGEGFEKKTISIPLGKPENKRLLSISYEMESDVPCVKIKIGQAVNNQELSYTFLKKDYYEDATLEAATDPIVTEAEFKSFIELLKHSTEMFGMGAHSARYQSEITTRSNNARSGYAPQTEAPAPGAPVYSYDIGSMGNALPF